MNPASAAKTVADLRKEGLKPPKISMEPPLDTKYLFPGTQELGRNGMYQLGYNERGHKEWMLIGKNGQEQAFENAIKGINGLTGLQHFT
jgi:hypothetical protein